MNLNQVTVPATDVAASVAFYQKLGLKLIVDSIPRYARFECAGGDSTFSVHYREDFTPNPDLVIYFECVDLDNKVTELKQNGIEFETDITDQTWLWRETYLKDPGGNLICLFQAGENRKNPPWRLSEK
jgi:catechol 2,3-dioxygenase-like lactoylglutathione lyase family enzyme